MRTASLDAPIHCALRVLCAAALIPFVGSRLRVLEGALTEAKDGQSSNLLMVVREGDRYLCRTAGTAGLATDVGSLGLLDHEFIRTLS